MSWSPSLTQFPLGPPGCGQGWALRGWLFSEVPPPTPSFSPGDVASTEPRGPSPTAHPGSVTCFPHVRSGHCITGAGQAESAPRLCPFPAGPWAEPSGPLRQRRVERIRSVNAATVIRTGAMGGRQHSHSGPAGASHGLLSFCHCVTWDSLLFRSGWLVSAGVGAGAGIAPGS